MIRIDRFSTQILPYDVFILRANARIIINQDAPRIQYRYFAFFRRTCSICVMSIGVAITFTRFRVRSITFCDSMIQVIQISLQFGCLLINFDCILRFRDQYFMQVRRGLIFDCCRANQGRAFAVLLSMFRIRRPFATLTNLTRIGFRTNDLVEYRIRIFGTSTTSDLAVFRCFPFRYMYERIARRIFIMCLSFSLYRVTQDDPSILMRMLCLMYVQVQFAIEASGSIIARILITEVVRTIRITNVDVGRLTILTYPTSELICRIPSRSALVFQVLTGRIPMFFRSAL